MGKAVVVVGTGFNNADGRSRADLIRRYCKPGTPLHLEREPNNPHDANAVAVLVEAPRILGLFGGGRVQIGYLREGTARSVAKRLDAGKGVTGRVTTMYAPPGREHPRVSAELTNNDA
ncbi:HIRAN domain-containing protein [Luteimonas qiangzhengi]